MDIASFAHIVLQQLLIVCSNYYNLQQICLFVYCTKFINLP